MNGIKNSIASTAVNPAADVYAPDGRRFTILTDNRLTAFVELHAAIRCQLELR